MGNPIRLISLKEFKMCCGMKCQYNGYFWTPEGALFRVESKKQSVILPHPDFPNQNSRGYLRRDSFHTYRDTMEITLQEIGDEDVVYDEKGDFVCVKDNYDERKGEIYIRRYLSEPKVITVYKEPQLRDYEDIPLKGIGSKISLSPEVYSKIFTHILSLDQEIRKELSHIRNGEISIQMTTKPEYYNMTKEEKTNYPLQTDAFARLRHKIVVAVISPKGENELYSTIWNIINLLGAHEIRHIVYPWTGDIYNTHHLNYLFQKGHHSWDKTTGYFKRDTERSKNHYYDNYKGLSRDTIYKKLVEFGAYPRSGESFDSIEKRLTDSLKRKEYIHKLGEYFDRNHDKHKKP